MATIKAPRAMGFSHRERRGYIRFLNRMQKGKKKQIVLDVSATEYISEGGFIALKAQAEKAARGLAGTRFILTRPKSKKALEFLKDHFSERDGSQRKEFHVGMTGGKDVSFSAVTDPALVDKIVTGLRKIGIKEYFSPFYDFLVELIGNATEHGIKNKNLNWWLLHYRNNRTQSMNFVFVDMGIGIVGSHRKAGLPFRYRVASDASIIKAALNGKLGSSTKQENRGNGLPYVRDIVLKGYLSDFMLVSNGVAVCEIDGKLSYSHNTNFEGTYYSWSINKTNVEIWMRSRL